MDRERLCDKHPDVIHQYATYSDGRAAFYKQLLARTREKYPDARFIVEPYNPYLNYIQHIEQRADVRQLIPDLIIQEKNGSEFITDERIYKSGLINYSKVGSTTPNASTTKDNINIAGIAASKCASFTWFGRFGKSESGVLYTNIREISPYIQLARVIPNWENIHQTPLKKSSWDGTTYSSPTAYISENAIYAIQPKTRKLFVVFLKSVAVTISDEYKSAKAYQTNQIFK